MPPESKILALFTPVKVGAVSLQHRIVLAPQTRFRADIDHVPTDLMVKFYEQRASTPGTLLITGATYVAAKAGGYDNVPGIYTEAQIKGWKKVVDAVHKRGSFIFIQLWALGRTASPPVLAREAEKAGLPADAYPFVSASDIPTERKAHRQSNGEIPRPLTAFEIDEYVELFADAAENAVKGAGFDGVEVHGANGYLVEQFLRSDSNIRTDEYGGSVENRCRFALRIVDAIASRIGAQHTAFRISPWRKNARGLRIPDVIPTFAHFVSQLKVRQPDLAYLHAIESDCELEPGAPTPTLDFVREIWTQQVGGGDNGKRGILLTTNGQSRESALRFAEKGDVVAFGKGFLSNPDLPRRLLENLPLTPFDRSTFYTPLSPKGYIDYPFVDDGSPKGEDSAEVVEVHI